ncbi:hypothetical protein PG999_007421 [Apiospora kogelbergensis]|uniref:Thiaminase-2/PQQC domain-containing protein n=1 Tax=Apiospora kogelbergensis TaxID=1337665 RepID=A0AAW0QYA4_9PEZI
MATLISLPDNGSTSSELQGGRRSSGGDSGSITANECLRQNPDVMNGSLIDRLWRDNCDLVSKFLRNEFCTSQAQQHNDELFESSQYYSVQDYYYLLEYAQNEAFIWKSDLPQSELQLSTQMNRAIRSLQDGLEYSMEFRHNLTSPDHLNVSEKVVEAGHLQAAPLGYVKWLRESTELGWFGFQVAKIACSYGWGELAHQLLVSDNTNKRTKFFQEWIEPNADWSYGSRLSEHLEKVKAQYVTDETFEAYSLLFRQGISFEIGFFQSAIGKTLHDTA